jgi:antitoxin component of MazEF toxin-antitoxin module
MNLESNDMTRQSEMGRILLLHGPALVVSLPRLFVELLGLKPGSRVEWDYHTDCPLLNDESVLVLKVVETNPTFTKEDELKEMVRKVRRQGETSAPNTALD